MFSLYLFNAIYSWGPWWTYISLSQAKSNKPHLKSWELYSSFCRPSWPSLLLKRRKSWGSPHWKPTQAPEQHPRFKTVIANVTQSPPPMATASVATAKANMPKLEGSFAMSPAGPFAPAEMSRRPQSWETRETDSSTSRTRLAPHHQGTNATILLATGPTLETEISPTAVEELEEDRDLEEERPSEASAATIGPIMEDKGPSVESIMDLEPAALDPEDLDPAPVPEASEIPEAKEAKEDQPWTTFCKEEAFDPATKAIPGLAPPSLLATLRSSNIDQRLFQCSTRDIRLYMLNRPSWTNLILWALCGAKHLQTVWQGTSKL